MFFAIEIFRTEEVLRSHLGEMKSLDHLVGKFKVLFALYEIRESYAEKKVRMSFSERATKSLTHFKPSLDT